MAKSIAASVGRMGGVNHPDDVKTVQQLLNKVPAQSGGPAPAARSRWEVRPQDHCCDPEFSTEAFRLEGR
jgi:hypothetical protein